MFLTFMRTSLAHFLVLSFPTRRSSDLDRIRGRSRLWRRDRDPVLPSPSRRCETPASPPARRRPRSDRKSTRLNSSHTVISYVVFCLKKKSIRDAGIILAVLGFNVTIHV